MNEDVALGAKVKCESTFVSDFEAERWIEAGHAEAHHASMTDGDLKGGEQECDQYLRVGSGQISQVEQTAGNDSRHLAATVTEEEIQVFTCVKVLGAGPCGPTATDDFKTQTKKKKNMIQKEERATVTTGKHNHGSSQGSTEETAGKPRKPALRKGLDGAQVCTNRTKNIQSKRIRRTTEVLNGSEPIRKSISALVLACGRL